jgi:PAS domain S-box-containing protein
MNHQEVGDAPSGVYDCFAGNSEVAALMRAMDWSQTAVGPVETWPQSLRIVVRIMLTSRYAMWMGWGSDLTFFYNDAYRPTLGVKHPQALGSSARKVWEEIWPEIGPRIETVLQTGEATWDEALLLFLERSGYPEETYHTFSYSPLANDHEGIGGMLCVVTEDTERVIGERRLALLREVAAALASTRTQEEVFSAIKRCLDSQPPDVPFTLTYLFDAEATEARLACATGVPAGHPAARPIIDIDDAGSPWSFRTILEHPAPLLIDDLAGRLVDRPVAASGRPPEQAVMLPLTQQGQERPAGFLVAAINPYRRLDSDYIGFVGLLAGQIAAGLANARAYEAERRRAESLAELDRAKTTFFSNVSHEFRTPLTLMLGPMEDALATDGQALEGESLRVVHRNGLRLLKLVNTLLDFSRIEAGRVQAVYEPTDLSRYTAELASVFRSAIERAGMRLIVDCPPTQSPVYIDREMWEKIVLNLLSNAFKFTAAGEIEVSLHERGDCVELSIRDTGVGISQDQLPHIFERFHRVEGTRARTQEGTGIGLALVEELARLHGGEVRVQSAYGKGSTFTVSIPLGEAHLPQDQVRGRRSLASTAANANSYVAEALRWLPDDDIIGDEQRDGSQEAGLREGQGLLTRSLRSPHISDPSGVSAEETPGIGKTGIGTRRILLADDNADMREYVTRLLSQRYQVTAVSDGLAAWNAALERLPDLVLSDVMMPGLDGFELLQRLRADRRTHTVPVILLSARAGEESQVEGISAGADDYLIKPFSAKELLARVAAHLEMARVRKEAADAVRQSEERLRAALDASEMGTFRWDLRTNVLDWDTNLDCLLGLTPGKATHSFEAFISAIHPDEQAEALARCERSVREGVDLEMEFRVIWPDNTLHWLYGRGKTLCDESGTPTSVTGACVDVTERKTREAHIGALNARLRRAMTETHHRVKNNLQLISALIDMQRHGTRDAIPISELTRLSHNIQALGVIHDILTQEAKADGDAESLSSATVLERLLPMLKQTIDGRELEFRIDDVKLAGRKATALALITNELVSNAVKHGRGNIQVVFRVADETAALEVSDEGPGLTKEFNPKTTAHTGIELIENIAGWDLGGETIYENRPEGGARITVRFPI